MRGPSPAPIDGFLVPLVEPNNKATPSAAFEFQQVQPALGHANAIFAYDPRAHPSLASPRKPCSGNWKSTPTCITRRSAQDGDFNFGGTTSSMHRLNLSSASGGAAQQGISSANSARQALCAT